MVLADVVPGTKLPLSRSQAFTYQLAQPARPGQVVSIPLGRRTVRGIVLGDPATQPGANVRVRAATPEPWQLPPAYLATARDVAATYRTSLGHVIKLMLPPPGPAPTLKPTPVPAQVRARGPALSAAQEAVAKKIKAALGTPRGFLLYGVTGAGKTEVYLEVARRVLARGGQVLLLVPEIAMTPQLGSRLAAQLGDVVVTWHSGLTSAERRRRWVQLASGRPALLLGPRSAAYVPLPKLGLVIVDEAHDGSYKQADQEPHTHAATVVRTLSRHARCPVVYGTATPSVELWHAATGTTAGANRTRALELLRLPERFGGAGLPAIELVDVRGTPDSEPISPASLAALTAELAARRQSIVLINRRGASRVLVCRSCGYTWRCPSCQRALVLHEHPAPRLACHYCDRSEPRPACCPRCGDVRQVGRGAGTQSIERALTEHFPAARIARLDRDVARSKQRMQAVADGTLDGSIDILVGTQLVAKGWDVERLGLVIVLDADQGLLVPDLRAHERTAQLLWQVAGRAGRRARRGRVLIETRQPDHPVVAALHTHDFEAYLRTELAERERFGLPPFRRLVSITVEGRSNAQRRDAEQGARAALQKALKTDPALARVTQLWPARDIVMPRGRIVRRFAFATPDPRPLVRILPLDVELDVDPEEL